MVGFMYKRRDLRPKWQHPAGSASASWCQWHAKLALAEQLRNDSAQGFMLRMHLHRSVALLWHSPLLFAEAFRDSPDQVHIFPVRREQSVTDRVTVVISKPCLAIVKQKGLVVPITHLGSPVHGHGCDDIGIPPDTITRSLKDWQLQAAIPETHTRPIFGGDPTVAIHLQANKWDPVCERLEMQLFLMPVHEQHLKVQIWVPV